MMSKFVSAGYGLTAIAPVFFVPSISTTSPSLIVRSAIFLVSILTMPMPISDCAFDGISPTFRCISGFLEGGAFILSLRRELDLLLLSPCHFYGYDTILKIL